MKLYAMTHYYYLIGKINNIEGSSIQHEMKYVFLILVFFSDRQ